MPSEKPVSTPAPPVAKADDFDEAQKLRKRVLKQLREKTPEMRNWILASLAADFAE